MIVTCVEQTNTKSFDVHESFKILLVLFSTISFKDNYDDAISHEKQS